MNLRPVLFITCLLSIFITAAQAQVVYPYQKFKKAKSIRVVASKDKAAAGKGLMQAGPVAEGYPERPADVWLEVQVPEAGTYVLEGETLAYDVAALKENDKTGMLTQLGYFQLGDSKITKRILFDQYKGGKQDLGKFDFSKDKEVLKIWLPKDLILTAIKVKAYQAPVAPEAAEKYVPKVLPSADRPRLWVNAESLPVVKSRLLAEENRPAWEAVKAVALAPHPFPYAHQDEIFHDEALEQIIEKKAFYYLMSGDRSVGMEAVDLLQNYVQRLEFGNITYGDITRELGRAIYTSALVYDWCYGLIDTQRKVALRADMQRLVRDMEIGWPPFYGLESIINGHGNEAQVCRDMLAWSLAIYDEDPEPYKYVSYTILEQLVPMRKFEYQSPRHNQGIDYGGYRFGWEMHAVWLYYRMLGYSVFDDNIKNMSDYWIYMRTPDGKMLRDGDMFNVKYNSSDEFYWKNPQTMLLCYAFSGNALVKGEFYKQGGLATNPVLFLLLNDPALKPETDLSSLPLTKDFGTVLGAMVARTGWSADRQSSDVIAEIKGGGYHFGNHQHADAGALQIYHHGIQVGDLGLYLSYGSPYDFNFNKRSISHSMLLVRDPKEPLLFRTKTNDGGTRFSQRFPKTVDEVLQDSWYHTGTVLASTYGPDPVQPSYSYFAADLTAAYSAKVSAYKKSFLFLNLKRKDVPAAIILMDEVKASDPDFEAFWQINTLEKPELTATGARLTSQFKGAKGVTYVDMIQPRLEERKIQLFSGDSSAFVFGDMYQVKSPWPEAKGTRVMVQSTAKRGKHSYTNVFQMTEAGAAKLPVKAVEKEQYFEIEIADKFIVMAKPGAFLNAGFEFTVPAGKDYEVMLIGLQDGFWNVNNTGKNSSFNVNILPSKYVLSWKSQGGQYHVIPKRVYGAEEGRY